VAAARNPTRRHKRHDETGPWKQVATAGTGTTYRIFSYGAILRRLREAGMTHVIKLLIRKRLDYFKSPAVP
jgi:hypothetical protein